MVSIPRNEALPSHENDDTATSTIDRRVKRRRDEDYFWLSRISEMSDQALMVFDPDLNLEFANPATLTLFDINESDLSRLLTYDDFIEHCVVRGDFGKGTETTLKAFSEDLKANARLNSSKHITERNISTPLGKHFCLRQSYGRDDRMLLAIRDVTEQYEAKKALELALDIGAAGYWSYNVETNDWKVHGGNLVEYLGQSRVDKVKQSGIQAFIHPDDLPRAKESWVNCLKNKTDIDVRTRVISKEGHSKWFRSYGVPRISEEGKIASILFYYADITQEMKMQNEQREAIEKVQSTLKARNDFLARLSHEVRTPMNAVIGISDALIHHNGDPAITPKLELIQTSAEKIIRIVDETLDHSKMEEDKVSLDPKMTDPGKCVDTVCRLWQEKATKNNITLTCRIDDTLPPEIMMDGYRYEQCINNLLSNAVKFTVGGTINVVLTKIEKPTGNQLVLAVKDNGIGMTPEQQKEIFTAYTQADNTIFERFGGTGLGMTITKQIVELMGGAIKVKSAKGEGSVFIVAIPYGQAKVSKPVAPSSRALITDMLDKAVPEGPDYARLRVLVVDDNETNHLVVKSLLESIVGKIVTANNGQQAIDCLENEVVDLVLMDIHMPVMDGIEATLSIRGSDKAYANIPIIALTADPQYQQKRLCKNIGMDEALAKPVKLTEILNAFDSIMGKSNVDDNAVLQRSA